MSETTESLKREVREWWNANPMLYDWQGTMDLKFGSKEFFDEIDRRFWNSGAFASAHDRTPFGKLIEYEQWRGKRVLDIGCGSGAHTALLARSGCIVTAVDLSGTAVELTKRRLELFDVTADVLEADVECLPFESESFDLVWSWGVIHHTPRADRALEEIHRVLRPGGDARVMVYHRNSIYYWVNLMLIRGVLMGGLLRRSPSMLADYHCDGRIARHFGTRELLSLMGAFLDVRTQVFSQPADVYPLPRWLKSWAIRLVPTAVTTALTERLGWFLFVRATK